MSFPATIDPLSPLVGEGANYTTQLLSDYLRLLSPAQIREDVKQFGFYLAKGNDVEHESIVLEELKLKLKLVLNGQIERHKNSWVNSLNYNLRIGNDIAIASMLASLWRRLLNETSLKKAQLSAYGYALNGHCRIKSSKQNEITALCEWCNREITVPVDKGFTCPHCNTYFADFKPQKMKIRPNFENVYFADFEEYDEKSTFQKIQTGEFELKKAKKKDAGQLAFTFVFGLGA